MPHVNLYAFAAERQARRDTLRQDLSMFTDTLRRTAGRDRETRQVEQAQMRIEQQQQRSEFVQTLSTDVQSFLQATQRARFSSSAAQRVALDTFVTTLRQTVANLRTQDFASLRQDIQAWYSTLQRDVATLLQSNQHERLANAHALASELQAFCLALRADSKAQAAVTQAHLQNVRVELAATTAAWQIQRQTLTQNRHDREIERQQQASADIAARHTTQIARSRDVRHYLASLRQTRQEHATAATAQRRTDRLALQNAVRPGRGAPPTAVQTQVIPPSAAPPAAPPTPTASGTDLDAVFTYLQSNPGATLRDIEVIIGITRTEAVSAIRTLADQGRIAKPS